MRRLEIVDFPKFSSHFFYIVISDQLGRKFTRQFIDYNQEQLLKNEPVNTLSDFLKEPPFWFETFQNWQSEFLSVATIVILTIFLRQKGSFESKPVAPGHLERDK